MRVMGFDPGLGTTGWGVIEAEGNHLRHVADGFVETDASEPLARRLAHLHGALAALLAQWVPDEAAVEETFVNRNPLSTLKLGQARGVVLLAPALIGIPVAEYQATAVKRAVVGQGHAAKQQVQAMVRMLLPGAAPTRADAADALAVAICHAHHAATARRMAAFAR
ncbi:crossover junction endodeoxyribonuclease RuvC [Elioraea sp.]|uniref:crossover junction endodeoxyribonuclease RuvC n=1 Tax=Elioraea sp. TaxID=2185103 RepID=UPI0025BE969B|nr:crossover junction endodeoxyribonuclease RuvC [Elioraea sp.]